MSTSTPLTMSRAAAFAVVALIVAPAPASAGVQHRVSAGGDHSCYTTPTDNVVTCWGYNAFGQIGSGDIFDPSDPAIVRSDFRAASVAAGKRHSCMIIDSDDSNVSCWGADRYGQIGDGVVPQWDVRTPVAIKGLSGVVQLALGYDFSCALTGDLSVSCWGVDTVGQLGRGDEVNDPGYPDAHPEPSVVDGLNQPNDVSAGNGHACAVVRFGIVNCWGRGDNGQLGNAATNDSSSPLQVQDFDGTSMARQAQQVVASDAFSCALTVSGVVRCWGKNDEGELGVATSSVASSPVPVTVAVPGLSRVTQITAGDHHVCVVGDPGAQVACWGSNTAGQLGDGGTTDRFSPRLISGIGSVVDISAGGDHTCARSVRSGVETVSCWGDNAYGQIGSGLGGDLAAFYSAPADVAFLLPPPPPVVVTVDTPSGAWVNTLSQTFAFNALATAQCQVDRKGYVPCAGGRVTYSSLSEGQHTLTVQHTADNGLSSSRRTDWKVDRTAPSLQSSAAGNKAVKNGVTTYGLSINSDKSGVARVEFSTSKKSASAVPVAASTVAVRGAVYFPKTQWVVSPIKSPKYLRLIDRAGNASAWFGG